MTTVVSANIGGFDTIKPRVEQSVPCEFVTVTEGDGRHPRLAAKEPKLRPWRYSDNGPWIWIDAAFEITSATFVEEALAAVGDGPIGQWVHPWRDCVFTEAHASIAPKYADTPVMAQAQHYFNIGHPRNWGLWCAGFIVYTEPADYLADLWGAEINRWGYQDQISQPVALRHAGMRPRPLPGGLHQSPWLRWHNHRNES